MQEMDYQFFTESVRSELALGNEIVSKDQQEKFLKMELYKMKDQLPFDLSGGEKQRLLVSIASLSKLIYFYLMNLQVGWIISIWKGLLTLLKT